MSRISLSLVPPGGWRFETDGITFEEQTFPALVDTVFLHRKNNSKPPGNPAQEIQDQICQRHKDSCLDTKMIGTPPTTFLDNLRSFATAAKNYMMNGGDLVDQNTANVRGVTCAGCHNNVPDKQARQGPGGCGKCGAGAVSAGIALVRGIALGARRTPSDEKLKACFLCGCDLKLKVWLPVKYFDPKCENVNKYPTFCWMKNCP